MKNNKGSLNPSELKSSKIEATERNYESIQWETTCQTSSTLVDHTVDSSNSKERVFNRSYTTILDPFINPNPRIMNFTKKAMVFDIPIYALASVADRKIFHAANIMAQYLDNNEDGTPDNPLVVEAILKNHGVLILWKNESDLSQDVFDSLEKEASAQDLGEYETIPNWHSNGKRGPFDTSLEEILHLITHVGYQNAYPTIFGEIPGTKVANAMDRARGGQFLRVPKKYPNNSWFSYDDKSCDYSCQVTEYIYWALTSLLGAQENRKHEIGHEWKLYTREKVKLSDPHIFKILTDKQYGFPRILPDGSYRK